MDDAEAAYVPFSQRAEWADVVPLAQDEVERGVIRIAYTERFREVHDYLRAVMRADERTQRVLQVTKEALDLNPANYTTWHFRRACLETLKSPLLSELEYVAGIILDNPKNYQVWYHRRWIAERLFALDSNLDGSQELQFTWDVFQDDSKNYHAWEHRQWAIRTFNLWSDELAATETLLEDDFRNNSAWNQRHFVVSNTTGWTDEVIMRELAFTQRWIRVDQNNESAWNYLRGIYLGRDLGQQTHLVQFCEGLIASPADGTTQKERQVGAHCLAFLVDLLAARLSLRLAPVAPGETVNSGAEPDQVADLDRAADLCKELAEKKDIIRRHYWEYMARKLLLKFGAKMSDNTSNFAPCSI